MANINGMLLAAGTTELPDSISYAYVVDPDYPEGKPLVAKDFKHRSVDLAAQGPSTPHSGRTGVLVGGGVANRREAALFLVQEPQSDRKIAVTLTFAFIFLL